MNFFDLKKEEKREILNECINTKKTYRSIADKYKIKTEDVYKIIDEFCKENRYEGFVRTKTGAGFITKNGEVVKIIEDKKVIIRRIKEKGKELKQKEQRKAALSNVQEIENWCIENGWKPRSSIRRFASCKKRRTRDIRTKRVKTRKKICSIKI